MNYRLLIDFEVIEFLETLSRKEQILLWDRFLDIWNDSSKFFDYLEPDSTGRQCLSPQLPLPTFSASLVTYGF